jgi:hypothetical protein
MEGGETHAVGSCLVAINFEFCLLDGVSRSHIPRPKVKGLWSVVNTELLLSCG